MKDRYHKKSSKRFSILLSQDSRMNEKRLMRMILLLYSCFCILTSYIALGEERRRFSTLGPDGGLSITRRVQTDALIHENSKGFPYEKQLANEFQDLEHPSKIVLNLDDPKYNITNVSPLIINNGDVVTVSFKSNKASASDWIAAYSPGKRIYYKL